MMGMVVVEAAVHAPGLKNDVGRAREVARHAWKQSEPWRLELDQLRKAKPLSILSVVAL